MSRYQPRAPTRKSVCQGKEAGDPLVRANGERLEGWIELYLRQRMQHGWLGNEAALVVADVERCDRLPVLSRDRREVDSARVSRRGYSRPVPARRDEQVGPRIVRLWQL